MLFRSFTRKPDPWESLVQKLGASIGAGVATVVTAPALQLR